MLTWTESFTKWLPRLPRWRFRLSSLPIGIPLVENVSFSLLLPSMPVNKLTCCWCSNRRTQRGWTSWTWRLSRSPRLQRLLWRVFAKSVRMRPLAIPTIVASVAFLVEFSSGDVSLGPKSTFVKATRIALSTWPLDPIVSIVGFKSAWPLAWILTLSNLQDRKEFRSSPSWIRGN